MNGSSSKLAEQALGLLTRDILHIIAGAEANFQQELEKMKETCGSITVALAEASAAQGAAEERAAAAEAQVRALTVELAAKESFVSAERFSELEVLASELEKQLSAVEAKLAVEKQKVQHWYAKGIKVPDLEKELQQEKVQTTLLRLDLQNLQTSNEKLQSTYAQLQRDYAALAADSATRHSSAEQQYLPSQLVEHGVDDDEAMHPDAESPSQPAPAAAPGPASLSSSSAAPSARTGGPAPGSQAPAAPRQSLTLASQSKGKQDEEDERVPATAPSGGLSPMEAYNRSLAAADGPGSQNGTSVVGIGVATVAGDESRAGAQAEVAAPVQPAAEDVNMEEAEATQASAAKKRRVGVGADRAMAAALLGTASQPTPAGSQGVAKGPAAQEASVGKAGSGRKASQVEASQSAAMPPPASARAAPASSLKASPSQPLGPLREKLQRLSQMLYTSEEVPEVLEDGIGSQIAPGHLDMSSHGLYMSQGVDAAGTGGSRASASRPSMGASITAAAAAPAAAALSANRRGSIGIGLSSSLVRPEVAAMVHGDAEEDAALQAALAPQFASVLQECDASRYVSQAESGVQQGEEGVEEEGEEGEIPAGAPPMVPSSAAGGVVSQSHPAPAPAPSPSGPSQPTSSQTAAAGGIPKKAGGPSASLGMKRGRKSLLDTSVGAAGPETGASQGAGAAAAAAASSPLAAQGAGTRQRASLLGKPPGAAGSQQLPAARGAGSQLSPSQGPKAGPGGAGQGSPGALPLYNSPASSSAVDDRALALTLPNHAPQHPAFLFSWDPLKVLPDATAPFDFAARGLHALSKHFPLVTKVIGLNPGAKTVGRNADVEMISSKVSRKQTVLETHVLPLTPANRDNPFARVRTTLHNFGINGVYVWRKGKPLFVMQGKPTTTAPELPSDSLELQHGDVICFLMCPYRRADGWPVEKDAQDKAAAVNMKAVPQGAATHTKVHPGANVYLTGPAAHFAGSKDTVADWPSLDGKGGPDPKDPRHCLNERHCWTTENSVHSGDNHQAPRVGYVWVYRVNEVALLSGEFDAEDSCKDRPEEVLTCTKVDRTVAGTAAAAASSQAAASTSQALLQTAPGTT